MNESGKTITLGDRNYTIFEHDTLGIPYRIVDENNNRYFLQLLDDKSNKYYVLDGFFRFKFSITREELESALNPPLEGVSALRSALYHLSFVPPGGFVPPVITP